VDPTEQCDLSGQLPDRAAVLAEEAQAWYDAQRAGAPQTADESEPLEEHTLRTLRTLGYAD